MDRFPAPDLNISVAHIAPRTWQALRFAMSVVCLVLLGVASGLLAAGIVEAAPKPPASKGPAAPQTGGLGMPTTGWVTTLFVEPITYESSGYYYDQDHALQYAAYTFHHGIDVSGGCVAGQYPVYAAAAGTVALAQFINDGYGTQVAIDHGYNVGGNGMYTYTFYAHMGNSDTGAMYLAVSPGQSVQAGQLLGYQGNDGASFGSCDPDPGTHLDWEIRISTTALEYGTMMRYGATAASPNFYTFKQVSYSDSSPLSQVSAGPFSGSQPQPTNTPVPAPTAAPPPPGPCGMAFYDVPGDYWAYDHIAHLFCRGIISGYGDGHFRPNNNTTRGQFTKMLVLGMGWNLYNPYFASFTDVDPGSPYYQYIETAHLRDVISGYSDGTFRSNTPITRAQTAKMLVVAKGWQPTAPGMEHFWDVPNTSWAYGYIETAYSKGVISGYSSGFFKPDLEVTRAQLSKMLTLTMQTP
ncbi:MAG: S-layer homology domain-containing protein [Chloroflexota bacterium]|nr:S-layer homology domain-containing protein [Chloroflexota bacterium]